MAGPENSEPPKSVSAVLKGWGNSSMPPMGLATLITALHYRPFQALPMLFTPLLVFSSYLSVAGFKIDSAGMTAAWSGMYVLLAARRRPASLAKKFSIRGAVRLTAMGLGTVNCIAGGYTYATGDRKAEEQERRELNKWGVYKDDE
ncbi:hypothetical protein QBC34DRAFT_423406 [Podospora aff. communis PSN243]|uniref:Altered inheritance of mitochondria protein 19 n=1 Tax=Podospora aff. communis PSN243 TaxID=3040156 RepID=A0AAV9GZ24_9PEZI|nr:hypothetical protein QBC34DRAFT_423406 [Podospora aff. communis PSN243]